MRAYRQLVFERYRVAEVDRRIDRWQALALCKTVHQSLSRAGISVWIHAQRAESLPVRNYTRVVLCLVAGFLKIPDYLVGIVLKHLLDGRVLLVIIDAGDGHYADHEIRQFIEYFLAYLVIHFLFPFQMIPA